VEVVHLGQWQVLDSAVLEKRKKGIERRRTLSKVVRGRKERRQPWEKARVAKAF
jgi:hypothetical protein